ncbi:MAG: hypothetical protein VX519_05050 [Myxococcota bacterium]|nr:hypothetical protein [Myxococcota bacterium]
MKNTIAAPAMTPRPLAMVRLRRARRNAAAREGVLGRLDLALGLRAGFLEGAFFLVEVLFLVLAFFCVEPDFAVVDLRRAGLAFGGLFLEGVLGATCTRLRGGETESAAPSFPLTRQHHYLFLT